MVYVSVVGVMGHMQHCSANVVGRAWLGDAGVVIVAVKASMAQLPRTRQICPLRDNKVCPIASCHPACVLSEKQGKQKKTKEKRSCKIAVDAAALDVL